MDDDGHGDFNITYLQHPPPPPTNWLSSRKIWSVEECEALPANKKLRTSRHQAWKRDIEGGGSTWQSSLKGQERATINQTNITVSKTTLQKNFWKTMWSIYGPSQAYRYQLELNWQCVQGKHTTVYGIWKIWLNIPCHHRFHIITVWPAWYNYQTYTLIQTNRSCGSPPFMIDLHYVNKAWNVELHISIK